ncbi:MAG: hypothetical protein JJU20_06705 [Opitutales bacterium]|nr:hypothetical protein [Opitutales bacterium]
MSNPQQSHDQTDPEPSDRKILFSALGWLGVFFLFALIVVIAYLPNRAASQYEVDKEARFEIKRNLDARQERLATTYDWVSQSNGVVRVPIERAMELTVRELRGQSVPEGRAP